MYTFLYTPWQSPAPSGAGPPATGADRTVLRITGIEMREIRIPLRRPFRISSGTRHETRKFLLELRHADGPTCWAECVAAEEPNYTAETVDTAWHALRAWLAPRLLGRELASAREVSAILDVGVRGHRMAKAALEMGAWGLEAVLRSEPLADLLGGTRERVLTGISLGIRERPAELVEDARTALAEGYRKVKMKVRPGEDVEHVRAVREALGPDAPLAVDGNAGYDVLDDLEALRRLDGLGLMMIEQPLDGEDLVRHAWLQEELSTPICLDESVSSPARAEDMTTLGSGRILNLKPGRVGGLAPSLAIHDHCRSRDVPLWCGGMLETGIGRAYNVALASLPGFDLPGDLSPSRRYWERDVVDPEWTMDDEGRVAVPREAPGLGVSVDRDRIEDLTTRAETLSATRAG